MKQAAIVGCVLCTCLFMITGPALSQAGRFVVEGDVFFEESGAIRVFIVNKNLFSRPGAGYQTLKLQPNKVVSSPKSVHFSFTDIPPGTYGIRCFQDVNNNGILDRGMLGRPAEPWGMSFTGRRPFGRPSFQDISFPVHSNVSNLSIRLQ